MFSGTYVAGFRLYQELPFKGNSYSYVTLLLWILHSILLPWWGVFFFWQLFESVEVQKLAASHSTLAETYILGFKYKDWVKIDLPILDEKSFRESRESPLEVLLIGVNELGIFLLHTLVYLFEYSVLVLLMDRCFGIGCGCT